MELFDCLIVGGGAAGIGLGSLLQELNVKRFQYSREREHWGVL